MTSSSSFTNAKYDNSYKENMALRNKVLSNFTKKTDPISYNPIQTPAKTKFFSNLNYTSDHHQHSNSKQHVKPMTSTSFSESFKNIFSSDDKTISRQSSKKTFHVRKNSPSTFASPQVLRRIFPDKYKDDLRLNENRKFPYKPNIKVSVFSYGKPSNTLKEFNDKQNELPVTYYKQYNKEYQTQKRSSSRSHNQSHVFDQGTQDSTKTVRRTMHPHVKEHMTEIISYKDALKYRIEKLTPKVSMQSYGTASVGRNLLSNNYSNMYYKIRNTRSQI